MRKAHQFVIECIRNQKNGKQGNCRVTIGHGSPDFEPRVADVYLFGNHVARYHYERGYERAKLTLCPVVCSNTTKALLNELLCELSFAQQGKAELFLYQRQFQWYLECTNGLRGDEAIPTIPVKSTDVIQVRWSNATNTWVLDRKGCELSVAA